MRRAIHLGGPPSPAVITPPVAPGSCSAIGMTGFMPFETGLNAIRLGLAGLIVPHAFIHAKELLLLNAAADVLLVASISVAGIAAMSAALAGRLVVPLAIAWRFVLFISAMPMISPGFTAEASGLACPIPASVHGLASLLRPRKET